MPAAARYGHDLVTTGDSTTEPRTDLDPFELLEASFDELDPATLYEILRLRVDVFVVEQECAFADLDGRDREPTCRHLWLSREGEVVAYLGTKSCPLAGRVFFVYGNQVQLMHPWQVVETIRHDGRWTVAELAEQAKVFVDAPINAGVSI